MDTEPGWIETATIIGTAVSAAVAGIFAGLRSGKKSMPEGEGRIVAGAFASPGAIDSLTSSAKDLIAAVHALTELLEDERRDRELARAVQVELDKRRTP